MVKELQPRGGERVLHGHDVGTIETILKDGSANFRSHPTEAQMRLAPCAFFEMLTASLASGPKACRKSP